MGPSLKKETWSWSASRDAGDLELGGAGGDTGDLEQDGESDGGRLWRIYTFKSSNNFTETTPSAVKVWTGLQSIPFNSTRTPTGTDGVAGSSTWSEILLGSGSGVGSVTGIEAAELSMMGMLDGWLGSESRVGLVTFSSAAQMV